MPRTALVLVMLFTFKVTMEASAIIFAVLIAVGLAKLISEVRNGSN
jgi:hypothetical protein